MPRRANPDPPSGTALFEPTNPNWKLALAPPPGLTMENDQAPVVGSKVGPTPEIVREPVPVMFRNELLWLTTVRLARLKVYVRPPETKLQRGETGAELGFHEKGLKVTPAPTVPAYDPVAGLMTLTPLNAVAAVAEPRFMLFSVAVPAMVTCPVIGTACAALQANMATANAAISALIGFFIVLWGFCFTNRIISWMSRLLFEPSNSKGGANLSSAALSS